MWPWPDMTDLPAVHWCSLSPIVVNLPSSGKAGYVALVCFSQLATCKREVSCLGYLPRRSCVSRMLLRQGFEAWNEKPKKKKPTGTLAVHQAKVVGRVKRRLQKACPGRCPSHRSSRRRQSATPTTQEERLFFRGAGTNSDLKSAAKAL